MSNGISRRPALTGIAATPALAMVSPAFASNQSADDKLQKLWGEREVLNSSYREAVIKRDAAELKLPWWAAAGPSSLNSKGENVGHRSSQPAIQGVATPKYANSEINIRPSPYDIKGIFNHEALFWSKQRPHVRARYRGRMREYIKRRRAQRLEEQKTGFDVWAEKVRQHFNDVYDLEKATRELCSITPTPTGIAVRAMLSVQYEISDSDDTPEDLEDCLAAGGFIEILRTLAPQIEGKLGADITEILNNPVKPFGSMAFYRNR